MTESGVPTELLDELCELDNRRADIKAEDERLKSRRKEMEEQLLDMYAENGLQSLKRNGNTIFLKSQLWARAKDGDRDRAVEVLRKCGMEQFVREDFNVQQVSAFARELNKEGQELPGGFDDGFDTEWVYNIRTRRAR